MTEHASTYVLVLAATYPKLKAALEQVMKEELNSESFERFQGSLKHRPLMEALEGMIQNYSQNHNKIAPSLRKIENIIEKITNIDYANLNEEQRERLPELAKVVDETNHKIQNEVQPALDAEKAQLDAQLAQQSENVQQYLAHVDSMMNESLNKVAEKFGVELAWTNSAVLNWEDLQAWMQEAKMSQASQNKIIANQSEDLVSFFKALIQVEAILVLGEDKADSVIEFVNGLTLEGAKFPEMEIPEASHVENMEGFSQTVSKLFEEIETYPAKIEADSNLSGQLETMIKDVGVYTTVDKAVNG